MKERKGKETLKLDGVSLMPTLTAGKPMPQRVVGFEHAGNRAIRSGDWKLVAENGGDWELYNMVVDRTERYDLAKISPEKTQEMLTLYNQWAEKNWVVDWTKVSAVLMGKQAGSVVLPDKDNPLRRTQKEVDDSVEIINKARAKRGLPLMKDLSK